MPQPIVSVEKLYKSSDDDFNEFIPVDDSAVETYFQSLDQVDEILPGPGQQKGARSVQKPKKRRVRGERQQMLNKLAQLRYRERKRQKQANLEGKVEELGAKVNDMDELQYQVKQLEAQNADLEKQVQDRETAVGYLRESGAGSSHVDSVGSSKLKDPTAKKAELDNLVQRWLATVDEIRQLYRVLAMDSRGALNGAALKSCSDFSFLPPTQQRMMLNLSSRVDMLVETVINLCVQVLRLDGLSIEAVMNANFDRCNSLAGWKDEEKWLRAAQHLNLSPQQQQRILEARSRMLQMLQRIYSERQQLNQAAARGLMGSTGVHDPGSRELMKVLTQLEENLKAEQRAVAEQEYVTFKHLLTPLQGGLFVLKAFPDHCDCLALLNAVHQISGGVP